MSGGLALSRSRDATSSWARVPRERHRRPVLLPRTVTQELAQLLHLAVRQRVHRVHDNRLDAPTRPRTQDMINDRNDIGQALAGAGTRRQHIAAAPRSYPDRLFLMPVKPQLAAPNIGLRLVPAEDVASRPMKDTVCHQTVN